MDKNPISVLIVDDSALMRNLIGKMVESCPDLLLAGKAMNGMFALQKIPKLNPDIIVLDLEMPEMNGIEFLKERKRIGIDIPVVILSSLARKGAEVTMEALALGASDFIMKPSGSISEDIHTVSRQLIEMLLAYGQQYRRRRGLSYHPIVPRIEPVIQTRLRAAEQPINPLYRRAEAPPAQVKEQIQPLRSSGRIELIAIGISTGGPNALREVFPHIVQDIGVPIVVVQHMPPGFTEEFAKSLDRITSLDVKEAKDGDILKPGRILIAPGDHHIEVEKRSLAAIARISETPQVNGHRPSADVLFASVAKQYGNHALGIIMTGMGRDGAREMGSIYREGGMTVAQDEQSCVVFGMPKVAIEYGVIHHVVSLHDMADTINRLVRESAG